MVYTIKYNAEFTKSLKSLPLDLQKLFYKKIEKVKLEELSRKHLHYGCPYFTEKVTISARLVYEIKENTLTFVYCFKNHKEYERWYRNEK